MFSEHAIVAISLVMLVIDHCFINNVYIFVVAYYDLITTTSPKTLGRRCTNVLCLLGRIKI